MVTDDDVGGSHLLPQALLPRLSGTVRGFSTEFHEGFVPHIRRSLIRTRLRARGSMWRNSSIPTTGWWTTSITWPTTVHQVHRHRSNHGLERTSLHVGRWHTLWRACHHGWRSTVICYALRATRR